MDVDLSGQGNANWWGARCAILCTVVLFSSLRTCTTIRVMFWACAGGLVYLAILSVSRSGFLLLCLGGACFLLTILMARGVRIWGAVFIVVALVAASQLGYLLASPVEMLRERFAEKSIRTAMYNMGLLDDFERTMFIGDGPAAGVVSSVGISSHNTFISTHIAFGGLTAWVYMFWLITLGVRTWRMFLHGDYPLDARMMVVAVCGVMVGLQLFNNFGFQSEGMGLPLCIVEKYTSPYSRRRIAERRALRQSPTLIQGVDPAHVSYCP